jgi:hypothetical protein
MAAQTHSPGMHWPLWLRHAALRNGILAGIYLSCVLVVWLEVANRVRELESFAGTRNFVAATLFVALSAIPVLRFRQDPGKLFLAGLTAWTLLTVTYVVAELNFKLLESRMGFLHVFMLGAVSYGFVAVLDWVFLMCAEARQQHIAQTREASALAGRRRAE